MGAGERGTRAADMRARIAGHDLRAWFARLLADVRTPASPLEPALAA
jgi:hypothetical protein